MLVSCHRIFADVPGGCCFRLRLIRYSPTALITSLGIGEILLVDERRQCNNRCHYRILINDELRQLTKCLRFFGRNIAVHFTMGLLNPLTSDVEVFLLTFDPDESAIVFETGNARCSTSAKWSVCITKVAVFLTQRAQRI